MPRPVEFARDGTRWGRAPDGAPVVVEGAMNAISLMQPWAQFVVTGFKLWETRPKNTKVRGRVAVHASSRMDALDKASQWPFKEYLRDVRAGDLALGHIIGTVEIVATRQIPAVEFSSWRRSIPSHEVAVGDWREGRWAYQLENPVLLDKPIRTRGYPWFWRVIL